MGANDKVAATFHGRSRLEELKACAELTSALPESEAEDVLARGVLDLLNTLDAVLQIPTSGFSDPFVRGFNAAIKRVRANINEQLGES